ncbi:hypothetical protein [Marinicella rhabdoformis]|uniref:hypothetical protein n=1 Tax=Marinicella rhabdoformis TaxID=2580566 RepID=UPI0012AECA7E|nr:hypothetical protein [Marinicella rhabdoformis]
MKHNQTIKCNACGASSVTKNKTTELLECQYCGSVMRHSEPVVIKQSKTKLSAIMISLPLIVVVLMVIFWVAFKNMRVNTPVEHYFPDGTTQVDHQKNIVPLAKPFVAETVDASKTPYAELLQIKSQVKGETANKGLYWIFSVKNSSQVQDNQVTLNRPGVVVSLFDKEGKRLAEQSGWSALHTLAPTEETEVLVFLPESPDGVESIEINTLASAPNQFSQKQELLQVTDFSVNEKNGAFEIIGDVKNSNDYPVKYTRVLAVARNQAGEPIGLGNAFATIKNLNASETSGFKIRVGTFLKGQPDHWTLWAQGQK